MGWIEADRDNWPDRADDLLGGHPSGLERLLRDDPG
jgi:hypothetical protein